MFVVVAGNVVVGIVIVAGNDVDIVGVYCCRCCHRFYIMSCSLGRVNRLPGPVCVFETEAVFLFLFLSPFYHHGYSINVAVSFENYFIIQLIDSMLKNLSHSFQKLMNGPSEKRIRKLSPSETFCIRFFSGAIDCVTKSQCLLDSMSSKCTFRFSSVLKLFFFSLSFQKKIHNCRSPESQTESKSGKSR